MTREEAIKLIEYISTAFVPTDMYGDYDDPRPYEEALDMSIEALKTEQIGEWVRKEKEINDCDGHRAYYWYECSVCGANPPKDTWKNEWHSNFCPSCGARMKGGTDD